MGAKERPIIDGFDNEAVAKFVAEVESEARAQVLDELTVAVEGLRDPDEDRLWHEGRNPNHVVDAVLAAIEKLR